MHVCCQRRALLFASQNNVAVAGGLKVQTAVDRTAAHPMHWLTMCATSAQLNGQLLASPTPGDVRTAVDGVASVLLRHFSSQSGARAAPHWCPLAIGVMLLLLAHLLLYKSVQRTVNVVG